MGNQSSKTVPPNDASHRPVSSSHDPKRVNRRISIQALSSGKATAADPSASRASAVAHNISLPVTEKPSLSKHLQSTQSTEIPNYEPHKRLVSAEETPARDFESSEDRQGPETVPEPSTPMNVPAGLSFHSNENDLVEPFTLPFHTKYPSVSQLPRPPRLPLPIAENEQVPGSPLLEPVSTADEDVSTFEEEADLPRKASMLSSTTADDIEVGDELQPYGVDAELKKVVPVEMTWRRETDTVYVVGTFTNWERKYPLHVHPGKPGLSTVLNLSTGTHHLKFIVNGKMRTSDELPTTVDFHNVLVNYIEVSAEDESRSRRDSGRQRPAVPQAIFPPQVLPEEPVGPEVSDVEESEEPEEPPEEEIALGDFRTLMPQALLDLDLDEDNPLYNQAVQIVQDMPAPPTLPMFLVKSILNGNMPVKDDNSVLGLPNYTVLNHLATSSIKNNVLATSVTTRYKRKFVTTIMYKPTQDLSR